MSYQDVMKKQRKARKQQEREQRRSDCGSPQSESSACEHEWVVFSTALEEGCLMLQCVKCGAMGSVDDPSKEEWSEAYHAPASPYRWQDAARVRVR